MLYFCTCLQIFTIKMVFVLSYGMPYLHFYLLQILQMEWELENLGHPELVKGEEDAKLENCTLTTNPNMILIIALICQIFSPKSQLIWLSLKLPKKQPLLTLTLLHSQPNSPPPVASRGPSSPTCVPQPIMGHYTCSLWELLSGLLPPYSTLLSSLHEATPFLSFKIQYSLHICTEPSLPSIITYLLIWAHFISSPRPQAPWWQAQNYVGINEKILETERYEWIDMSVTEMKQNPPTGWILTRFKVLASKGKKGMNGGSSMIFCGCI